MISWNEIRTRAVAFAKEWEGETREMAEYQSFWDGFFEVFGTKRRSVARYQEKVQLAIRERDRGFIDLFWPGTLIVEHKSGGKNLDSAYSQAGSYFDALPEDERPRYIIVTDYARIRFYDLEGKEGIETHEFPLEDFSKHIHLFSFIAGRPAHSYKEESPVNRKAVRAVVRLYRALDSGHYPKEHLDRLLIRLVFCFFADDTGIFDKDTFSWYLKAVTKPDGSDFGMHLTEIFQLLNTDFPQRQTNINSDLASLPYVNGGLFAEVLPSSFFNTEMREAVLHAAEFDWSAVSPAIFGSMFQFVMDAGAGDTRHDFGAHYTSERNILKVLNGLFLEGLYAELEAAGHNAAKLHELWGKVGNVSLLDPACGCGNFLVVAYRELRQFELEILKRLYKKEVEAGQASLPFDVSTLSKISVERMYGIELLSFPAEIAQLSLWLVDHLANVELGDYFGKPFSKLPLREQPHIKEGNALTLDWESVVPKNKLTYIIGNPPFIGSKVMSDEQRAEIAALFGKGGGVLDYVSGWYAKAAQYIQGTSIGVAFVSTNSITQGEQVGILWKELVEKYNVSISFAHRTFKWSNEAPGKAAVFCVIIGFSVGEVVQPKLYEYEDIRGEPREVKAKHINPYLVDAPDVFIQSRTKPLCNVPEIGIGNKPIDGGMYLFTPEEREMFVQKEPGAAKFFRRWIGADEFLNGYERWCLWLGEAAPQDLRDMPEVMRRIDTVRQFRLLSKSAPTQKLADKPTRFHVENMPKGNYLVIPEVSSERRFYIPIGFEAPTTLASNLLKIVPNATLYHFGVLQSVIHMAWMRAVAGRLESRYRYSKDIVYNNFPWPEDMSAEKKTGVDAAAQAVLDARAQFPGATLADLYDPNTMPKVLLDAHHALDRAVDAAYGRRTFKSEPERLEFLFGLDQKLIAAEKSTVFKKTKRAPAKLRAPKEVSDPIT